jgi:hypothetical protein
MQNLLTMKSNSSLLENLGKAAKSAKTDEQLKDQRVSFIFASMDKSQSVTKAQIRGILQLDK